MPTRLQPPHLSLTLPLNLVLDLQECLSSTHDSWQENGIGRRRTAWRFCPAAHVKLSVCLCACLGMVGLDAPRRVNDGYGRSRKGPQFGAFLPAALMYFLSGKPRYFYSGVDNVVHWQFLAYFRAPISFERRALWQHAATAKTVDGRAAKFSAQPVSTLKKICIGKQGGGRPSVVFLCDEPHVHSAAPKLSSEPDHIAVDGGDHDGHRSGDYSSSCSVPCLWHRVRDSRHSGRTSGQPATAFHPPGPIRTLGAKQSDRRPRAPQEILSSRKARWTGTRIALGRVDKPWRCRCRRRRIPW